jgi:regulation of enolase protein 1 (concanavalin A-like superfamily)
MSSNKEVPMHRFAARLLFALGTVGVAGGGVAGSLLGAPAPFPRPVPAGPWFDGWERFVDPRGDCRFERTSDRLTITVPGKGHQIVFGLGRRWFTAPHMVRDVEGDFILDVRVGGTFLLTDGCRRAGILVLAGDNGAKLHLVADSLRKKPNQLLLHGCCCTPNSYRGSESQVPPPGKTVTLRLERRGQTLLMKASPDGKAWETVFIGERCFELPRKVKVGVVAEATAEGTFQAVFDQFKLTPFGDETR